MLRMGGFDGSDALLPVIAECRGAAPCRQASDAKAGAIGGGFRRAGTAAVARLRRKLR